MKLTRKHCVIEGGRYQCVSDKHLIDVSQFSKRWAHCAENQKSEELGFSFYHLAVFS